MNALNCKSIIFKSIRGWLKILKQILIVLISSIRGYYKLYKEISKTVLFTSKDFRKSLAVLLFGIIFLTQSFSWLYDEYIGSGALIKVGEISHQVIHYDESSPHMHIVGIPVKEKNKYGMELQVGKSDVFTKESLNKLQDKMRILCIESFNKEYNLDNILKEKRKKL